MIGKEQDFEGDYWIYLEAVITKELELTTDQAKRRVKTLRGQGDCDHSKQMYNEYADSIESAYSLF